MYYSVLIKINDIFVIAFIYTSVIIVIAVSIVINRLPGQHTRWAVKLLPR